MERTRQISLVVIGFLIIVILILAARWTGDQIKQRFLTPKNISQSEVNSSQTSTRENSAAGTPAVGVPGESVTKVTTPSAIPSTGTREIGYIFLAFLAVSGLASLRLAGPRL